LWGDDGECERVGGGGSGVVKRGGSRPAVVPGLRMST
jgi:hypothetical protein